MLSVFKTFAFLIGENYFVYRSFISKGEYILISLLVTGISFTMTFWFCFSYLFFLSPFDFLFFCFVLL